jgi:predicted CoA-binding protein
MPTTLASVKGFLACRRVAIVGISRDPSSFSVKLFRELNRLGFDVIPVNPKAQELEGRPCFASVKDIQPPIQAVLLMTSPLVTERIVRECFEIGVKRIWMYRAGGKGAVSAEAVQFCRGHEIEVIPGECPLMFLSHSGAIHHAHGWIRKLTGRYPARAAA